MIKFLEKMYKDEFIFKKNRKDEIEESISSYIKNYINKHCFIERDSDAAFTYEQVYSFMENEGLYYNNQKYQATGFFLEKNKLEIIKVIHPEHYKEQTFFGLDCLKTNIRKERAKFVLFLEILKQINIPFLKVGYVPLIFKDDFDIRQYKSLIEEFLYTSHHQTPHHFAFDFNWKKTTLKFKSEVLKNISDVILNTKDVKLFNDEKYDSMLNNILSNLK